MNRTVTIPTLKAIRIALCCLLLSAFSLGQGGVATGDLHVNVKDPSGNVVHWAGELNSPGVLSGQGWTRKMFVPGDEVTLSVFPSKAGTPVGVVDRSKPIMSNGKEVVPAGRNVD